MAGVSSTATLLWTHHLPPPTTHRLPPKPTQPFYFSLFTMTLVPTGCVLLIAAYNLFVRLCLNKDKHKASTKTAWFIGLSVVHICYAPICYKIFQVERGGGGLEP